MPGKMELDRKGLIIKIVNRREKIVMPRRDGTGPIGRGAKTGRGLGANRRVNAPVYGGGFGRGCGRGAGRGLGQGFGRVFGFGSNAYYNQPASAVGGEMKVYKVYIDENCIGCGLCVDTCRVEAISLLENRAVIDKGLCLECGACIDVCPLGAIRRQD